MVAADARTAVAFALSPGNAHDAPQGRKLLDRPSNRPALVMGRACEDDETRPPASGPGFLPVMHPKSSRVAPWAMRQGTVQTAQRGRAPVRRLKGFHRVFSRFEKLDVMFLGFVVFALVIDALHRVNKP